MAAFEESCRHRGHVGSSQSGPTLPTFAVQQVGSYVGCSGRCANVVAKAARDVCSPVPRPQSRKPSGNAMVEIICGARHCLPLTADPQQSDYRHDFMNAN